MGLDIHNGQYMKKHKTMTMVQQSWSDLKKIICVYSPAHKMYILWHGESKRICYPF